MALNLSGTTGIVTGNIASDAVTTSLILNANVTPAKLSQPMTAIPAQVATVGATFVDFTSIPSWVKRITVMLNQISTNGSSVQVIQIGTSAGIENSGYASGGMYMGGTGSTYVTVSSGFVIPAGSANSIQTGNVQICLTGANAWTYSYSGINTGENGGSVAGGFKGLTTGVLDRVRLTNVGSNTFDGGSVGLIYEG